MNVETASPSALHLTVVSANLHVAAGVETMPPQGKSEDDIRIQLERAATLFAQVKPDLLLLQEVDFDARRSGCIDQAAFLAERLGMHAYRAVTLDSWGQPTAAMPQVLKDCRYGIALLSRKPLQQIQRALLPNPPENEGWPVNESRVLLSGQWPLPSGESLWVGVTHLDYRSDENRRIQLERIVKVLPKSGWILGGDFNQPLPQASPAALPQELMAVHGWNASKISGNFWPKLLGLIPEQTPVCSPTYPLPEPLVTIDGVLADGSAQVKRIQRLDSKGISDHHFVQAEIVIHTVSKKKPTP